MSNASSACWIACSSPKSKRLNVLFHSVAAGAEVADGRITAVLVANKAGLVRIEPRIVIDCTGDADIAAWAGAPTEKRAELQPLTMHFRIGHVRRTPDLSRLCRVGTGRERP